MKYTEKNKPLVCMMTQSTCYKGTRKFTPKGVLWHSTGANNPTLKRYVQPDDNAKDKAEWLAKLGKNQYGNDWNHIDRQAGMNFWIGKLADGTVAAVQTMPWDYRPWSYVLRYPDQKVGLKLALLGIDAALNDKIGYDQSQNRTYLKQLKSVGWEPSRITVACEADCSAGVCANITAAGYLLGIDALKNHTGTYTGNMRSALKKAGFQVLTDSKYLTGGDYLLPGDILLYDSHHTATNVTIGKKVRGDGKPTASTPATPAAPTTTPPSASTPTTPATTKYYRVRRSWADKASQIGAFTVFQNAKNCVDANPGYAAFDDDGNQVYPKN